MYEVYRGGIISDFSICNLNGLFNYKVILFGNIESLDLRMPRYIFLFFVIFDFVTSSRIRFIQGKCSRRCPYVSIIPLFVNHEQSKVYYWR